jgi:hypothetical protein
MLTTTLALDTVRTNTGHTAVVANVGTRSVLIGESDMIGRKRAIMDVLTVNNRHHAATLERKLRRLEHEAAVEAAFAAADAAAEAGDDSEADRLWTAAAMLAA